VILSSGIGIAWPGWYWVDFSSIRAFWPFSTRSRSSRLAVRKQAGGDWHYRASVTAWKYVATNNLKPPWA